MKSILPFCILAVFAVTYTYGKVTSCYVCQSLGDKECLDPFDEKKGVTKTMKCDEFVPPAWDPFKKLLDARPKIDSPEMEFRCVKIKGSLPTNEDILIRSCVPVVPSIPELSSICAVLEDAKELKGVLKSCHECDSDKCNGSSYVALSVWSVLAFLLAKML